MRKTFQLSYFQRNGNIAYDNINCTKCTHSFIGKKLNTALLITSTIITVPNKNVFSAVFEMFYEKFTFNLNLK